MHSATDIAGAFVWTSATATAAVLSLRLLASKDPEIRFWAGLSGGFGLMFLFGAIYCVARLLGAPP